MTIDSRYEVTLETRDGQRVLAARAEREAALMAESVMRRYEGQARAIGVSVACADPAARNRLADYLNGLAFELALA